MIRTCNGTCASSTPEEYFTSICNLSKEPLNVMQQLKLEGLSLRQMGDEMLKRGYPVWGYSPYDEIYLSVCAGKDFIHCS